MTYVAFVEPAVLHHPPDRDRMPSVVERVLSSSHRQGTWYYLSAIVVLSPVRTISLKVPDEIDERLEARARGLGKTKSEVTREALLRFLEEDQTAEVSCLDLVRDLVGSARGPGDLATNKKYLRGYGR